MVAKQVVTKESFVARPNPYLRLVSTLLPAGALGMSVALVAGPARASAVPAGPAPREAGPDATPAVASVADQLQSIREAVSTVAESGGLGQVNDPNVQLAWWGNGNGRGWGNGHRAWGNGPGPRWGNGGFHNWRNGGRIWVNF